MDYLVAQFLSQRTSSAFPFASFLNAGLLTTVKYTLEIISVILFVLLVMVIVRIRKMWMGVGIKPMERVSSTLRAAPASSSRIAKQWNEIKARLERSAEAEWKVAVIEADKLIDDLLRRMGYQGMSMGERLKSITPQQMQSLDALWSAHKMRNMIVHDPETRLLYRDARQAIANYELFLQESHILEG